MQIPSSDATVIRNATRAYETILKAATTDRAYAIATAEQGIERSASVIRLGYALALSELTGQTIDLTRPADSTDKRIVAKFASTCIDCAQDVPAGTTVLFHVRARSVSHIACPAIHA